MEAVIFVGIQAAGKSTFYKLTVLLPKVSAPGHRTTRPKAHKGCANLTKQYN